MNSRDIKGDDLEPVFAVRKSFFKGVKTFIFILCPIMKG